MKNLLLLITVIGLSFLSTACKRTATQPPGEVVFSRAGISLTVGEGWQRIDRDPGVPVCPPTLIGEAGMVRAMLFDAHRTDAQNAATRVRAAFETDSDAVKDSFQHEGF